MPTFEDLTFREMTSDEIARYGNPSFRTMLGFDGPTLISFYIVEQNLQYRFCETCPGNCVIGRGFWVDPNYRSLGVFTHMWTTMRDTYPITNWYGQGTGTPDTSTYYWQHGVIPLPTDDYQGNVKTRAERISDAAYLRTKVLAALTPEV